MNNFKLIYKYIDERKIKIIKNKRITIKNIEFPFTSISLNSILEKVKYLKRYSLLPLDITFDFCKVEFSDKVTYIILDMMLYDLFITTNFDIRFKMELNQSVWHYGIRNTALMRSIDKTGRINKRKFINEYEKKVAMPSGGKWYRRYITREKLINDISIPSKVVSDIRFILNQSYDDTAWVNDVCEAIGEVIDNTTAHTDSDCLVDIDICPAKNNQNDNFNILNIVIANFSEERIFDRIKNNIVEKAYCEEDILYKDIYTAYENHSNYFNESYTEDDFFHITAFQRGVTSRNYVSGNSGTGLTTLIKNIVGKTTEYYSYVLSGKNVLFFREEYLQIQQDGYIGFNEENDYMNIKPSDIVIGKSEVFIPGTIFQLSLVRKRDYGKEN